MFLWLQISPVWTPFKIGKNQIVITLT
jgi:hypothetical protein